MDKNKFAKFATVQNVATGLNFALIAIVAIVAFGISYRAQSEIAFRFGAGYYESYFWPLLIDVPIALFMINILVMRWIANKQSARFASVMVIGFSFASVAFNVLHAKFEMPESVLYFVPIAIASVAPIALIATFHSLQQLIAIFAELQFAKTEPEPVQTQLQIPATVAKPAKSKVERKPAKRKIANSQDWNEFDTLEKTQYLQAHTDKTIQQIADSLQNCSYHKVYRHKKQFLNGS